MQGCQEAKVTVFFSNFCLDTGFLEEDEYIIIESDPLTAESEVRQEYGGDWVPKIRILNGNTRTRTKIRVWVGFVSEYHGYFRVGYP